MSDHDLGLMWRAEDDRRRWMAERENASARVELATISASCAYLLSQHEPVSSLGINRNVLRVLLSFVRHGDRQRLHRDITELQPADLGARGGSDD